MVEERVKDILYNDEKTLWINGINKKTYLLTEFIRWFFISIIIGLIFKIFIKKTLIIIIISMILFLLSFIINLRSANNTILIITDKRIIKKSKIIKNKIMSYSIKKIDEIEIQYSFFDKIFSNKSAAIIIIMKNLYTNINKIELPKIIIIKSLNNASEAYNILKKNYTKENI